MNDDNVKAVSEIREDPSTCPWCAEDGGDIQMGFFEGRWLECSACKGTNIDPQVTNLLRILEESEEESEEAWKSLELRARRAEAEVYRQHAFVRPFAPICHKHYMDPSTRKLDDDEMLTIDACGICHGAYIEMKRNG